MTYAMIQSEPYEILGPLWNMLTSPVLWIIFGIGAVLAIISGIMESEKEKKQKRSRALESAKKSRGEGERGTNGMTKAERGQYWTEQARREKQRERQEQAWRQQDDRGGRFTQPEFV